MEVGEVEGERIGGRGEWRGRGEERRKLGTACLVGRREEGPPEPRAEVPGALWLLCGSSPRLLQARCG